ncbi:hypothetical protein [Salinimicrobium xinjiangense]|uniref:hypothetical protein n=1 Tax=Salinimicrobium xinjiangense TaxID=438596 RepID=UPI000427969F|nr:hypothetical protein [Salinimicrobium xinjiangense]
MKTAELKKNLHALVDRIENEELLQSLLNFLKENENQQVGKHWDRLTQKQKEEVFAAYEESRNEDNLIAREDFFK